MKFLYRYRTKENVVQDGEIAASDRDEAFAKLKQVGIRPERMIEAPGLLNKILGKGKRWITIAVLLLIVIMLVWMLKVARRANPAPPANVSEVEFSVGRSQIYGDPSVLQYCETMRWSNVFDDPADMFFAAYAIPGRVVEDFNPPSDDELLSALSRMNIVEPDELPESARMKRMVNGMKSECRRYIEAGGTIAKYIERLRERQKAEVLIRQGVLRDIAGLREQWKDVSVRPAIASKWYEKNEYLREMGMQGVPLPEGWEDL